MKKSEVMNGHLGKYVENKLINELGISIRHASRLMQLSHGGLNSFIKEKCNLSGKLAFRLEMVFGSEAFNAKALLALQDDFLIATEQNSFEAETLERFDPTTVRIADGKHPRAIPT